MKQLKIFAHGKFKFLLVTLIFLIFLAPFLTVIPFGKWIIALISVSVIIAIVFTTIEKENFFLFASSFGALTIIVYSISLFLEDHYSEPAFILLSLIFYIFAIRIVSKKVLETKKVTHDVVFAALCIYLLLGVAYARIYMLIEFFVPGSFEFARHGSEVLLSQFELIYFSFSTLTTVGFGDIVTVNTYAKSIVILEEITGVLYLAVLVSRLISDLSNRD